jgi:hypothetical protein
MEGYGGMSVWTVRHQWDGSEDTKGRRDDHPVRAVSHWAVDHAPSITFAQVRELALKQGLRQRDLVAQFQEEVEQAREVFARVWDKCLSAVVLPYWAVIQWYEKATAPRLALDGETDCACGCGAKVWGRRKWAKPGCRMRVYRQSRTAVKEGGEATNNQ